MPGTTGPLTFLIRRVGYNAKRRGFSVSGSVISGLYAAGRVTAGLPRTSKGYASGMSVGDATLFGRLAGKSAAANADFGGR